MKIIKVIASVLLAVVSGFITTYILAYTNLDYAGEFVAIPHFIPDEDLSFKIGLALIILIYLIIFSHLARNKFFAFAISMLGMVLAVFKYKSVSAEFLPINMAFVPALLEFAKLACLLMAIGIIVQWVVDGGLTAVKFVNKSKG